MVPLVVEEEIVHIHPFYLLQKTIAEIVMDIRLIRNEYENKDFRIDDVLIIMPVLFHSYVPLKRIYWNDPWITFDPEMRADEFARILDYSDFYRILVTPSLTEKKEEVFAAATPFYKTAKDKDIENFMLTTDFPVDETAKFAALYEPQKPFELEWRKDEHKYADLQDPKSAKN